MSQIDEATVWLTVRAMAACACDRCSVERDDEALVRLAHDLARFARLEVEILGSREAVALREVLAVIEVALRRAMETRR